MLDIVPLAEIERTALELDYQRITRIKAKLKNSMKGIQNTTIHRRTTT